MKKHYPLSTKGIDFSSQIARHSADKTFCYKTVHGQGVNISYFYPVSHSDTLRPAIVLVHGGGWASHKIFADQHGVWQGDYLGYLARYYADHGFVCVSIDYRLSREEGQLPDYQLIDCYDDCEDAVDYILENARLHGIDWQNMYVLGESAGGHLAGMLATMYQHGDFRFRKAFLINPILDFENCPTWRSRIPRKTEHTVLRSMTFSERVRYLSPIHHIQKDTCPVVLIHGEQDSTVGLFHSENFYAKMCAEGLCCDLHIIEGTRHAFLLAEYTDNPGATQIGVSILDSYLLS